MHRQRWVVLCVLVVLVAGGLVSPMAAQSLTSRQQVVPDSSYWDDPLNWKQQFVPDYRPFWDDSQNWTTNYGPAYRDTVEFLRRCWLARRSSPCVFIPAPDPYPCTLSPDGQSANCVCTVASTTNYTLLTAILNRSIYNATLEACGREGLKMPERRRRTGVWLSQRWISDSGCNRDLYLRSHLAPADLEGAVAS